MSQANIRELEELMGYPIDSATTITGAGLTGLVLLAFAPRILSGLAALSLPLGRADAILAGAYLGILALTAVFLSITYLGIRERLRQ